MAIRINCFSIYVKREVSLHPSRFPHHNIVYEVLTLFIMVLNLRLEVSDDKVIRKPQLRPTFEIKMDIFTKSKLKFPRTGNYAYLIGELETKNRVFR